MNWEDAWQQGQARWDAGASPPVLQSLLAARDDDVQRALVPGCGAGYDLLTLAAAANRVIGLDLAPTAAKRFDALRSEHGASANHSEVIVADFFNYQPDARFNLIWDYTFLCAIEPPRRTEWAARMVDLLVPGGELWTLIFPVDPIPMNPGGPPYPMTPKLVQQLLEPAFEQLYLAPVDESHPRRQGKEWLGLWRLC